MHWAAKNGHEDIVKFLLEHGADPCLENTVSIVCCGQPRGMSVFWSLYSAHAELLRQNGWTALQLAKSHPIENMIWQGEAYHNCCRLLRVTPMHTFPNSHAGRKEIERREDQEDHAASPLHYVAVALSRGLCAITTEREARAFSEHCKVSSSASAANL